MRARGPMPPALRILVLGLFLTVFGMVGAQQLFGVVAFSFATAELLDEYAPTEEDRRLAAELQARAVSAGSKVKVTPMDVANARRQGQLSTLERSFDEVFTVVERRPVPEPGPTHHAEGAFYRDPEAEAEARGPSPLVWAAIAFGAIFAGAGAVAAALLAWSRPGSAASGPEEVLPPG